MLAIWINITYDKVTKIKEWRNEMLAFPRKSKTLQMLLSLKQRCTLSEDDEAALYTEQLGYQGERAFALRLEKSLRKEYVVLYDVLLEQKNSHFQMDCLLICEEQIYLIELKYLEGNYYFHDNDFYTVNSRKRIKNPFYQIQRSEDLLRSFLHKHKLPYNIHSYVVFNHPSFTLYQAPIQTNMILPTQIEKFLQKLNNQPVRTTSKEELLVETFYREHIEKNPFERLPAYPYEKLNKGIFCLNCQEQLNREGRYHVRC